MKKKAAIRMIAMMMAALMISGIVSTQVYADLLSYSNVAETAEAVTLDAAVWMEHDLKTMESGKSYVYPFSVAEKRYMNLYIFASGDVHVAIFTKDGGQVYETTIPAHSLREEKIPLTTTGDFTLRLRADGYDTACSFNFGTAVRWQREDLLMGNTMELTAELGRAYGTWTTEADSPVTIVSSDGRSCVVWGDGDGMGIVTFTSDNLTRAYYVKVAPRRTLFIGDSFFAHLNTYGYMEEDIYLIVKADTAPRDWYDMENNDLYCGEQYDKLMVQDPEQTREVYFYYGVNDYDCWYNIDYAKRLLGDIRRQLPDSPVYVLKVLPVSTAYAGAKNMNKQIAAYNKALQKFCATDDMLIFIDGSAPVVTKYGNLKSNYTKDGLHLTKAACGKWWTAVQEQVEKVK